MADNAGMAFTTAYRYERVIAKGNKTFTFNNSGTVTIAHSLGYRPYFKLYYKYGNGNIYALYSGTGSYAIDGTNQMQVDNVRSDGTNVYIDFFNFDFSTNPSPAVSGTVYYRIYAEPTT